MMVQFLSLIETIQDSLQEHIPTLNERFNFVLPLVVILLIFAFFLGLKLYADNSSIQFKKKK
ncbi:MAG: hypothetical protein ACP5US_05025 [Candidatus Kryptoniota bacterium]